VDECLGLLVRQFSKNASPAGPGCGFEDQTVDLSSLSTMDRARALGWALRKDLQASPKGLLPREKTSGRRQKAFCSQHCPFPPRNESFPGGKGLFLREKSLWPEEKPFCSRKRAFPPGKGLRLEAKGLLLRPGGLFLGALSQCSGQKGFSSRQRVFSGTLRAQPGGNDLFLGQKVSSRGLGRFDGEVRTMTGGRDRR
jgi:hypothetical protein